MIVGGLLTKSCTTLATPWTTACQAPLSMGFPRQNTGVGWHFLLQGIFPTQGWNPCPLHSQEVSSLNEPAGKSIYMCLRVYIYIYVCVYMIDRYTVGSVSLENLDLCTWVSFSLELRWGIPRRRERSQVSIASPLPLEWRVGSKSSVPWPSPQAGEEDRLGEQETCPLPIAFKWKGKMAFPANRAIFLDFSQDLWPAYSLYSHCIALQTIGLIHSFHEPAPVSDPPQPQGPAQWPGT